MTGDVEEGEFGREFEATEIYLITTRNLSVRCHACESAKQIEGKYVIPRKGKLYLYNTAQQEIGNRYRQDAG